MPSLPLPLAPNHLQQSRDLRVVGSYFLAVVLALHLVWPALESCPPPLTSSEVRWPEIMKAGDLALSYPWLYSTGITGPAPHLGNIMELVLMTGCGRPSPSQSAAFGLVGPTSCLGSTVELVLEA